jgi:hypothetical protein
MKLPLRAGGVSLTQALTYRGQSPRATKEPNMHRINRYRGLILLAGMLIVLLTAGCSWSIGGGRDSDEHHRDSSEQR